MLHSDTCRLVLYYCDRKTLVTARLVNHQWLSLANHWLFSCFRFSTEAAFLLTGYYEQFRHLCYDLRIVFLGGALQPFTSLKSITFADNSQEGFLRWAQMVPFVDTSNIAPLTRHGLSYLHSAETVVIWDCDSVKAADWEYLHNARQLVLARRCSNLDGLAHLQNLDKLALPQTAVCDWHLKHVGNVRELNLALCELITDKGMLHLARVKVLNLLGTDITDSGLAHLVAIEAIDLTCCRKITDNGLSFLSGAHTVYLRNCDWLTDKGLAHLSNVRRLDITSCSKLRENGLLHLKRIEWIGLRFREFFHGLAWTKPAHTLDLQDCTTVYRKSSVHSLSHAHKIYIHGSWLENEPSLTKLLPHTIICRDKTVCHSEQWKRGFFRWRDDDPDGRVYE